MANKYIYKVLRVALMGVGLMLSACANTLELATPIGRDRSQDRVQAIRNAVAYFDNHIAILTRSANADPSEVAPFSTGNIVTDWESAVTLSGEEKRYTDFSMRKDNRFYLLLGQEGEQREAVELYSRFASVEDFGLDTMNQYVATYIPDVEYLQSYYNVAHDYGINCAEWYEFSGVVMYTRPSGHYVAAYRYEDGLLAERSFLYNKEKTTEENIADFCSVMEALTLGVAVAQEGTRGDNYLVYIEPIIIVDNITGWQAPELEHLFPEEYEIVEPSFENLEGAGGGGGGSSEKEEDEPTGEELAEDLFDTSNLSEDEKEILVDMLSDILKDCMGKELLIQLLEQDKITIYFDLNRSSTSSYNYKSNKVVMTNYNADVLLHELFHAYQFYQVEDNYTTEDKDKITTIYCQASANYEVEGQIARYVYLLRNRASGSTGRYEEYCKTVLGYKVKAAGDLIDAKGNLYIDDIIYREQYYEPCIKRVLEIAQERKITNVYFNEDSTMDENIKNIQALSESCE